MKRIWKNFAASLILCAVTGCTTVTTVGEQKEETVRHAPLSDGDMEKTSRVSVTEILDGLEKQNYNLFIRNFTNEYRKSMDETKFKEISQMFRNKHGKRLKMQYMGKLERGVLKTALWKVVMGRTPEMEAQMKKGGLDPAKTPDNEMLAQLVVGNVDGKWKVFGFMMN